MNAATRIALHGLGKAVCTELLATRALLNLPLALVDQGFCFPTCLGRWVAGQGALDASPFLLRHLEAHHATLLQDHLTAEQQHLLANSCSLQLALLRAIKPCLPGKPDHQQAYRQNCSRRIAFSDGCWDIDQQRFRPIKTEDMVFHSLPVPYQSTLDAAVPAAQALLEQWFPCSEERQWLLRYMGRALAPADPLKLAVIHCDTLGPKTAGNQGKTTFQYMLESLLGPGLCQLHAGGCLALPHSTRFLQKLDQALCPPLITDLTS